MSSDLNEYKPDWDGYNKYCDELDKREVSNTEGYDKAILALSTAGLAFSVSILEILGLTPDESSSMGLLYLSWICYLVAIISTVYSFPIANKSNDFARVLAEQYYLEGKNDAFKENVNAYTIQLKALTNLAGAVLVLALILTVLFAGTQLSKRANQMSDQNNSVLDGAGAPTVRATNSNQTEGSVKHGAGAAKPRPSEGSKGSTSNGSK